MRILCFSLVLLIAGIYIGISSCKKEEPDPNKDYRLFICKVNGQEWKPKVEFCFLCTPEPSLYAATYGERTIRLEATQHYTNEDSIKVYQFFYIGFKVESDNSISQWTADFTNLYNGECGHYQVDTTYTNKIKINRFDGVYRGILKGEFEFRFVNENNDCFDTLLVSEGRFDLRTDL